MSTRKLPKPKPLTQSVTIKDVPSEIAEMFNLFCSGIDDGKKKARSEVFAKMVRKTAVGWCGDEEIADREFNHLRIQREEWNFLVAKQALRKREL